MEALFGACLVTLNDIDSVYCISLIREYTHSIKFKCCLAARTILWHTLFSSVCVTARRPVFLPC